MTFVEVKFECINWWGNEVYRTKNGTPILRLPEDGWFSIADPSDIDGESCSKRLYKKYVDAQHRVDKHKELTPMERTLLYGYLNPKYHFADYPRKRVH